MAPICGLGNLKDAIVRKTFAETLVGAPRIDGLRLNGKIDTCAWMNEFSFAVPRDSQHSRLSIPYLDRTLSVVIHSPQLTHIG